MAVERKSLTQLFVPICFETLFYMLSGMVDTLMLSSMSDQAVGAVGTANTYIGVFIIMFGVISSGMVAVMTQNIGAGRPGVAYQARQLGLAFNAVVGILMSAFLALCSGSSRQYCTGTFGAGGDVSSYRRRRMLFECTHSDFCKLLKSVWIYQAVPVCFDCRKCDQFYIECGIFVCDALGCYGRCYGNRNFSYCKPDHGCCDGSGTH